MSPEYLRAVRRIEIGRRNSVAVTRSRRGRALRRSAVGCLLASLASCVSAGPSSATGIPRASEDANAFGPRIDGLRLRATLPRLAARGDLLRCELSTRIDVAAPGPSPDVDGRPVACVARLRLTDAAGAAVAPIQAIDPCGGEPDPPPPDGSELRQLGGHPVTGVASLGIAEFPLASQWDRVSEGRYRGIVEVVWTGDVHGRTVDGAWRGTLVSQPLELEVSVAPDRWLDLHAPASLSRSGVAATERVRVRNGFIVGLSWSGNLPDGSTGGIEGGALRPRMFDETLAWIDASNPRANVTIFERSPDHLGRRGPSSGDRILWTNR